MDPTSSRIVYLGGSATADLELGLVDVAAGTAAPIDAGSPFYFSWAPQGKQLLVHVGDDRLDTLALDGTFTPLGDRPGMFSAPVWTADGRTLIYVSAGTKAGNASSPATWPRTGAKRSRGSTAGSRSS